MAKWIWYPGDREIFLANKMLLKRDYRGITEHPFWRIDNVFPCVFYYKSVSLKKVETIYIKSKAIISVLIDESQPLWPVHEETYLLPEGEYTLVIAAARIDGGVPAVRIEGETVFSDESWTVSLDKYRGEKIPVGFSDDLESADTPDEMKFHLKEIFPVELTSRGKRTFDFGKDVFGYLCLRGKKITGKYFICYGESLDEADSKEYCEIYDELTVDCDDVFILDRSRGFRFVSIISDNADYELSLYFEELAIENRGFFSCSDGLMNEVENISVYTLFLNMRETFLDGIKRDRWVWGGDVFQSILFNLYSYFDKDICRRSLWALIGKEPYTHYINHIMDYSYLWFISLHDYYFYSGDLSFLRTIFARAVKHLEFCLAQFNKDGFVEGNPKRDWVFIEWAEFPKDGVVSVEQILFSKALLCMSELAEAVGNDALARDLKARSSKLKEKIISVFYDRNKHLFYNNSIDGKRTDVITWYPNIFAVIFDFFDQNELHKIVNAIVESDNICEVKTPYAKFFAIMMLYKTGQYAKAEAEIRKYWGGMIDSGATTFWELYDSAENGTEKFAMYGRPYGKSLCHAWGAGPIYINGRFYLGVKPDDIGYTAYSVTPNLADYEFIDGVVPTPTGHIKVYMDKNCIKIGAFTKGRGKLYINKKYSPVLQGNIESVGENDVVNLEEGKETHIILDIKNKSNGVPTI